MAGTDGSIAFDSGIKTDGLKKDLSEMEEAISDSANSAEKKAEKASDNMRAQAAKLAAEYKKAGMNASDAMKKAWEEVKNGAPAFQKAEKEVENFASQAETELQNVGESANQSFQKIPESAKKNFEDAGLSADNFAQKVQSALAAAGLAYGAKEIVDVGVSYEKAMNQVAVSTGAAGAELENLQSIASNVYTDNFGESMEDAANGVAEVYKRTGLVDEELQKATESAYQLQDAFGYELNESTQAATQLMKVFGLTADEAYNLIAQGAQKGLDQNGDMLDTLNEYSVQFANLGYSAEDMFNMLANGVQNGTWSVDKLGDAVKEMNIRLNDGTADEALQALGLGFAESATDAAALQQAALNVSKAEVDLAQAQESAKKALSESGASSLEYQDALNKAEQAQINLEKAQSDYNATASATSYNLDEIKGKLAAGGEDAQAAIQEIMTALSQVEEEQDRYVLGQTLMGTMWEDLGEDAVNALMNTQGEISTTTDALEEMAAVQYDDLGSRMEALKRKIETEIIVPVTKKYMPQIEKAIDYVSEHLDEIVEHAKPIAAGIAAAFAVKKITDFGTSAVKTVKTVKTAFQLLNTSNPLGWISLGVTALAGLAGALKTYHSQQSKAEQEALESVYKISDEIKNAAEESKEKLEDFYQSIEENRVDIVASEKEFENIQELKDRLDELVDSDGIVKAGHEEEVNGILDQINAYAGTSYDVLDGVITKNGEVITNFQEASAELDKLVEKQRAQSVLSTFDSDYNTAISNLPQQITQLADARTEYENASMKYQQLLTDRDNWELNHTGKYVSEEELSTAFEAMGTAKSVVEDLSATVDGYGTVIEKYESASAKIANGDYESAIKELQSIYSEPIKTEEAGASLDDLINQYDTAKNRVQELQQMMREGIKVDDNTFEQAKTDYVNSVIELGKASGMDGGEVSGKEFMQALQDSTLSETEKVEAIKAFLGDSGRSCTEEMITSATSDDMKQKANKGMEEVGDYMGQGAIAGLEATQAALEEAARHHVWSAIAAARDAAKINSPSHLMRDIVGHGLGEGTILGLEQTTPDLEKTAKKSIDSAINAAAGTISNVGLTAEIAHTMVPETLGIMHAQGASTIAPYNPVFKQAYSAPQQDSTPSATPSSSPQQTGGDIIIPISIGDETIETVVVNAVTRANAASGGWSV